MLFLLVVISSHTYYRQLPNVLADKAGPWNTILPIALITSVVAFAWIAVTSQAGLIAFAVLYGFFSGSIVALASVLWAILSPNMRILGTRIGMTTVPMAAGLLIGNPIAGKVKFLRKPSACLRHLLTVLPVDLGELVRGSSFMGLQVFCGCMIMAGALFLLAGRLAHQKSASGWKL